MTYKLSIVLALLFSFCSVGCNSGQISPSKEVKRDSFSKVFDPALKDFVKDFEGAGEGVEGSGKAKPLDAEESIKHFVLSHSLEMEVVASEPLIRQPLNLHFDERGRLWVVQYLQYPFPAGLKIVKYDRYLRAKFDKLPSPPPNHVQGADKITILEDKDGDGRFESAKDFVTGLNIATSVVVGRGGVWVLNPPHLLFYRDPDRNDIPDNAPEVHLSGFGLEDTHAVANSLRWGPDGWLYGVQGSTTTANVNGIRFLGQAVWRYHPETRTFELFAEGGGNTWSLDFDSKGRAFSGTNTGGTRGLHYVQGGYYTKSWTKHGPLTNPFAFGSFPHMEHSGYQARFSSTLTVYEGGALPDYEGQIIAGMSLTNRVQASRLLTDTSTFKTVDTDVVVQTDNRWFRPVDTKFGPDGALYFADWHDMRLSHLSPVDNWDKMHGRIYRLKAKNAPAMRPFDLARLTSSQLFGLLDHPNRWFREQARRILGERRDESLLPKLRATVEKHRGQIALEALWTINLMGGLNEDFALRQLNHGNPYVRSWTIRLLGDGKNISPRVAHALAEIARRELHPEVRSQLASSCRRIPAAQALPIIRHLLLHHQDALDRHIPLLIWWAIESKADSERGVLLEMLREPLLWSAPLFTDVVLPRLARRYTADRGKAFYTFSDDYNGVYSEWKTTDEARRIDRNLRTCAQLLGIAAGERSVRQIFVGMEAALRGHNLTGIPAPLQEQFRRLRDRYSRDTVFLSLLLRLGLKDVHDEALRALADHQTSRIERQNLIASLSDAAVSQAVPQFLRLLNKEQSEDIRLALLVGLRNFADPEIGTAIVQIYRQLSPQLRTTALETLCSRESWSETLLHAVENRSIAAEEMTHADLDALKSHARFKLDPRLKHIADRVESYESTTSPLPGEQNYRIHCASCHLSTGRGLRRSLADSKWVAGPEEALIRIILHGKIPEVRGGEIMPSLGVKLTDGQISSILTYVRARWGKRAGPVKAETVTQVRKLTTARRRVWTNEELQGLVEY